MFVELHYLHYLHYLFPQKIFTLGSVSNDDLLLYVSTSLVHVYLGTKLSLRTAPIALLGGSALTSSIFKVL